MKNYFAGIDAGSTYTKGVLLDVNKSIVAMSICKTRPEMLKAATSCFFDLCNKSGVDQNGVHVSVTGYGKDIVDFASTKESEQSCLALAAHTFNSDIRTIIEVGGEDAKVLSINREGKMLDFVMNDKCSAGTGRFLEIMVNTMDITFDDIEKLSKNATKNIFLTSICSVFAQTEITCLISKGERVENIITALLRSMAYRISELSQQIEIEDVVCMAGGLALSSVIIAEIERLIKRKILVVSYPQFLVAHGAALKSMKTANISR